MYAQTDVLTSLEAKGQQLRQETRERLFSALLAQGDAEMRKATAERIRDDGQAELTRLQVSLASVARDAAQAQRARLFDVTTPGAHVQADPAKRHYARQSAQDAARKITTATAAREALTALLRNPGAGEGMALVRAAALAERCHDQGWTEPLEMWLRSPLGETRGGVHTLAKLTYAERVANGEASPALSDLPSAAEMAGDTWPAPVNR